MERDNNAVSEALKELAAAAKESEENLMQVVIKCVKNYATLQEVCDVFRDVFGEADPSTI